MYDVDEIKLDTFMICLEVVDYDSDLNALFWLQYFENRVLGKIHVVLCRPVGKEIKEQYSGEKIVWLSKIAQSFEAIDEYIGQQDENDVFIIVGAERLARFHEGKNISSVELGGKMTNIHVQEEEDWVEFSKKADLLYEKYQTKIKGLILICNVNEIIVDMIYKELDTSNNMSISQTEVMGGSERREDAMSVLKSIANKSLDEALEIIEQNKSRMTQNNIIMCKAVAYHGNGNISKSIELLKGIYFDLSNEQKIFLADMCVIDGDKISAQQIFEEVYSEDNQLRGLYELGLRAYDKESNRYQEIIKAGLEHEPDNRILIERYANLLSDNGEYRDAANYFRKMNSSYYELVARVNDLLAEKQTDIKIVKAYLYDIVEENPELKNQAILRVALYAKKDGHYYNAYNLLREADLNEINDTTQDILKTKLSIMGDTEKACKALGKIKPHKKESHRELLLRKRWGLLLESINFFSHFEKGYTYWRRFMECQQMDIWNISLKTYLMYCIQEIEQSNLSELLKVSYIRSLNSSSVELDCDKAISFLRASNCREIIDEDLGCTRKELVEACWKLAEIQGSNVQRILVRYYCSIGASVLNENPQDANNYSLSIVEYAKSCNKEEKNLIAALFLMSWGNSQYRLGSSIEGMACVLVAIRQLIKLKEATPVVEEGLNILSKYLGENEEIFSDDEKRVLAENLIKLEKYNESLKPVIYIYTNNITGLVNDYEKKINTEEKTIEWLVNLANYITGKMLNKEYNIAVRYIKENYQLAERLVEQRRDMAPKIFFSWGEILVKFGKSIENLMLGLDLLDKAIDYIQKRRQVHHQEERAALAELYDKIIRTFLCFSGLYYSAKDVDKEIKEQLKRRIYDKLALSVPLSVIEQKKYNLSKNISDELEEKHHRLEHLKQEYAVMIKNNRVESDEVSIIAKEIEQLTNDLVQNHPYYRPLSKFNGTDWQEIQRVLKDNEVVYQYVLTDLTVVSILITNKWIDIRSKCFTEDSDTPYEGMKKYGSIVETSHTNDKRLEYVSSIISEVVAEHMCEYVFNYEVKSVYILPDISKSIFPFTAVEYRGKYLIDVVDEIINFIDYEQLLSSLNSAEKEVKIVNKVFGKKEDPSISYIKDWLDNHSLENFVSITDCLDDYETIIDECEKGSNTVVIYGHGVKDFATENIEGAQTIQGANSMINLREILDSLNAENLILISCVAGTPNSINPEISSGTWTSIFERFNGNIIACRWSVPTVETIEMMDKILDNLLNKKLGFHKSLLMAQREMKASGKTQLCWAGVESWIN